MKIEISLAAFADRLLELTGQCEQAISEQEFTHRAAELFALQFTHVPVYREFCQSRGVVPGQISGWADIPALPTRAFKEYEVTSLPHSDRTRVFLSSATTGEKRSRHFHSAESLRVYEAALLPWFARHLLGNPERAGTRLSLLLLTPQPDLAPNSSLVHMFDTVARGIGFARSAFFGVVEPGGAWGLDLREITGELKRCTDENRPALLLGTAFSLVHLSDGLAEHGQNLRLPAGSRVMETGGYKGRSRELSKAELHTLMGERLGVGSEEIIAEYGMSELSSQAYDRIAPPPGGSPGSQQAIHRPGQFRFPPWVRVQIVSPENGLEVKDGEAGLIRVFDLANVWSILAVQTEDLAVRRTTGFELTGRAAHAELRGCSLLAA